jgi:DNA processing protein
VAGSAPGRAVQLAGAWRWEDRAVEELAEDLAEAGRLGARLVTPQDAEWPHDALRAVQIAFARERAAGGRPVGEGSPRLGEQRVELAAPLSLWVRGAARLEEAFARAVAVVGSRAATPYGAQVAAELGYGLASRAGRWSAAAASE